MLAVALVEGIGYELDEALSPVLAKVAIQFSHGLTWVQPALLIKPDSLDF